MAVIIYLHRAPQPHPVRWGPTRWERRMTRLARALANAVRLGRALR